MSLNSLVSTHMRRTVLKNLTATRANFQFQYPHSFRGVNNAYNNIPSKNNYPEIQRTFQPGEQAPLANQNVRVFPDWYKPYNLNYESEGYFFLSLAVLLLFGYSYTNDIKEQKGRLKRKLFPENLPLKKDITKDMYAAARVKAGDPNFTKYLVKKERAQPHH